MKTFRIILLNTLIATTTNSFLWFALTFWMYLETRSVVLNAVIGAMFPVFSALFGVIFGTFVDLHKKKSALLLSSAISLSCYTAAGALYVTVPTSLLQSLNHPFFWIFVMLIMAGSVAGNLRGIAVSTLVSLLVPEEQRDKANGQVGIVNGTSFAITSIFSGLAIAYGGMGWCLLIAVIATAIAYIHILILSFYDPIEPHHAKKLAMDWNGAIQAVRDVPGLSGFIFFSLLNNFLGGVFFALMDPYGLELVSVQEWGFLWGALSFSFIIGGLAVSKFGLGNKPLRQMFIANMFMWITGAVFPLQPSIWWVAVGMLIYMQLVPLVEAAEQTVLQKIVPVKKQGRVFGFATTVENLASPITALSIGPIAQFFVIPFMTKGTGATILGPWFGAGVDRGIALIFVTASLLGFVVTLIAFRSRTYGLLTKEYES